MSVGMWVRCDRCRTELLVEASDKELARAKAAACGWGRERPGPDQSSDGGQGTDLCPDCHAVSQLADQPDDGTKPYDDTAPDAAVEALVIHLFRNEEVATELIPQLVRAEHGVTMSVHQVLKILEKDRGKDRTLHKKQTRTSRKKQAHTHSGSSKTPLEGPDETTTTQQGSHPDRSKVVGIAGARLRLVELRERRRNGESLDALADEVVINKWILAGMLHEEVPVE